MAGTTTTMTPTEAAAALSDVRTYRQGLTGRAAGIVWMIWALALSAIGTLDVAGFANWDDIETPTDGWGVSPDAWVTGTFALVVLAAAIIASNATWKAHAIERGSQYKAWVAWLVTPTLIVVCALGAVAVVQVLANAVSPIDQADTLVYSFPTFCAVAAAAIAVLQRKRVHMLPGLIVALLMVVVQGLIPLIAGPGDLMDQIIQASYISSTIALVLFVAVGLLHFKRG